jgi:hypothetical protein
LLGEPDGELLGLEELEGETLGEFDGDPLGELELEGDLLGDEEGELLGLVLLEGLPAEVSRRMYPLSSRSKDSDVS